MAADLVEFLRARLDEDEQAARAAGDGPWTVRDHTADTVAIYDSRREPVVYDEGRPSSDQMEHIARHDPARVLAEVDAKRRIIDLYEPYHWHGPAAPTSPNPRDHVEDIEACRTCVTNRLLALPYRDHPDYRPEWVPEAR